LPVDAYAIARYVSHYHAKNGYAPKRGELGCSNEDEDALERNGVLKFQPLYAGGPAIVVVLTDKGLRMSQGRRP
jgi:hypothetical protein